MSLHEIVEAADAVVAGALSGEALNWLKGSVLELTGRDVGIGTPAERSTLTGALKGNVAQGAFDARIIEQIAESAENLYLRNWSVALAAEGEWRGERVARSIASHTASAASTSTGGGATGSATRTASVPSPNLSRMHTTGRPSRLATTK